MNNTDLRPVLRVGELAYWDSFAGLIACRVTDIRAMKQFASGAPTSEQKVFFTVTATRNRIYKHGEKLQGTALSVVPRKAISHRRYGARITYYTVKARSGWPV